MTAFRPGDRVRCLVSTVDELGGWELLDTPGTVIHIAPVGLGTPDAYDEVWVRCDRPAPT
jgi:hypothetical protein